MKIHEIMTPCVQCVGPDENLVETAMLMRELDVGVVPVCEDGQLIGMLTDRDIVLRAIADGLDASETTARDAMSTEPIFVNPDQDVDEAVRVMEQHQIRRTPVMDDEQRLIGIVSLGDIAVGTSASLSGGALKEVSEPAEPVR